MELGTWADWANVAGAAVVGGAVIWLTRRTNNLAEAANRTSEAVAALESKRDQAEEKSRQDEERLILVSLSMSVGAAFAAVSATEESMGFPDAKTQLKHEIARTALADVLRGGLFTVPDSIRSRMHVVGITTAAQILRTEGSIPVLVNSIAALASKQGDVYEFAFMILSKSVAQLRKDMEKTWERCLLACHEAGLTTSRPKTPPATGSSEQG